MDEVGKTTGGRPVPARHHQHARHAAVAVGRARRAAPPGRSPRDHRRRRRERIAREHKAVVLIGAGVHSNETGSAQAVNELVWRLATERSPAIDHLLRNLIVLVVPSQNPDGLQMMAEWQAAQRRHALRGRAAARALSPLRRPRQQPRRLHADAGRDAAPVAAALSRLAARGVPRPAPDGADARPDLRAAVSQSRQPEHRPAGLEPGQPARPDDGGAAAGRGQDGRAVGRDLQRLLAGRQQHDAVVAQHRRDAQRSGQRAADRRDRAGSGARGAGQPRRAARSPAGVGAAGAALRRAVPHELPRALAGRTLDAARRGRAPPAGRAGPARRRRQQPRDAEAQLLRDAAADHRAVHQRRPVGVRRARRRSATGAPPTTCCTCWTPAARGGGRHRPRRREPGAGRRGDPAGAAVRTVGQGPARAAGLPGASGRRRSARTTSRRGRWACRWASASTGSTTRVPVPLAPSRRPIGGAGRIIGSGPAIAISRQANAAATLINRLWATGATVGWTRSTLPHPTRDGAPGNGRRLGSALEVHGARRGRLGARRAGRRRPCRRRSRAGAAAHGVAVIEPWGGAIDAGWTRWVLEQHAFEFTRDSPGRPAGPSRPPRASTRS